MKRNVGHTVIIIPDGDTYNGTGIRLVVTGCGYVPQDLKGAVVVRCIDLDEACQVMIDIQNELSDYARFLIVETAQMPLKETGKDLYDRVLMEQRASGINPEYIWLCNGESNEFFTNGKFYRQMMMSRFTLIDNDGISHECPNYEHDFFGVSCLESSGTSLDDLINQ